MIDKRQEEIIKEINLFNDWAEKYEYIIDLGKELEPYPQKYKTDEYIIKECQSQLWLYIETKDNILHCYADSDALISKGLAAMVIKIVNNRDIEEIRDIDFYVFDKTNLYDYITMQRSNGLVSLINKIKQYAKNFNLSNEQKLQNNMDTNQLSTKDEVVKELKTVFDPEIPVNIYDLGLIYNIEIEENNDVKILMTLTAPGCPAVDYIMNQIEEKVGSISWVKEVNIEITFDPPWDKDMMSDEAKLELGFM